ncbi:MAG: zinc-ribbon domain-containing protein [Desulfobacteraceae bacterium]|jgi:predicted Zn finger-like uncharacterized protein
MDILCDQCQSRFNIPDEKLPPGTTATLTCKKCQNKIKVKAPSKAPEQVPYEELGDTFSFDEEDSQEYDSKDKPFDFVEEEGNTALVCEADPKVKEKIRTVLDVLEYHVTEVENGREALKKMRYHVYDLVVVNELFDTKSPDQNGILIYLERLNMDIRRQIFVTLITKRFRTMDQMTAFQKSVNIIVNLNNIDDFDKILRRALADNDLFYRIYKEQLA